MGEQRALSIRQPWALSITHGGKDIENRDWPTRFRGRFYIHAAKRMTQDELDSWRNFVDAHGLRGDWSNRTLGQLDRGGIVGEADLVDCVTEHKSPWFMGRYGFVLANVTPLRFMPCKGALGFFVPTIGEQHKDGE